MKVQGFLGPPPLSSLGNLAFAASGYRRLCKRIVVSGVGRHSTSRHTLGLDDL